MDRGSCLLLNVNLIIQIWRGLLLWEGDIYRRSYTSICAIVSKPSMQSFLKLCAHNCSYCGHCLLLRELKNNSIWKFVYSLKTDRSWYSFTNCSSLYIMQNFQSPAHIIFYVRFRPILIKSSAFHVVWYPKYPSYVFWISNEFIKQTEQRNIGNFSIFSLEKFKFY